MAWLLFSFLSAFFESVAHALGKRGAQKIDVLSAAWAQRFFALFILFPLVLFNNSFQELSPLFWIALLIASSLNTLASLLFFKAIKDSPLSLTLPVMSFTPVFLLLTSPIMIREWPSLLGTIGILSVVTGSYVLNLSTQSQGYLGPIKALFKEQGTRLMLGVAFIWSITSNFDKVAVLQANPLIYTLLSNSLITVFLSVILILRKQSILNILKSSKVLAPVGLAAGVAVAFQMTAISTALVANVISVKRTGLIFSGLWGKFFFKETHIKERLIATLIMIAGVMLIAFG